MAGGARGKLRGGRVAGVSWVCRFRRSQHAGAKLGDGDSIEKVGGCGSRELGARGGRIEREEDWIVVRGRRIRRAGLRINSQGDVYAPDSEGEQSDMDMKDAARSPTIAVPTDVGPAVVVSSDGDPPMNVAPDGDPGMELSPEVQERLEVVLAGIDPLYHDVFISLYKVAH
ncbi:unnamed protein product [Urochloa humidicola]